MKDREEPGYRTFHAFLVNNIGFVDPALGARLGFPVIDLHHQRVARQPVAVIARQARQRRH